jgi:hypothetical protein
VSTFSKHIFTKEIYTSLCTRKKSNMFKCAQGKIWHYKYSERNVPRLWNALPPELRSIWWVQKTNYFSWSAACTSLSLSWCILCLAFYLFVCLMYDILYVVWCMMYGNCEPALVRIQETQIQIHQIMQEKYNKLFGACTLGWRRDRRGAMFIGCRRIVSCPLSVITPERWIWEIVPLTDHTLTKW